MEVMIPVKRMEFDFNSARSSPYLTAPSSPRRFGDCFFSAPTSPARLSEFYRDFDSYSMVDESSGSIIDKSLGIPFDWEEKPGTPKSPKATTNREDDFAFDISGELNKASLTADELFDGGKIRPLKPPPGLVLDEQENLRSPLLSPVTSPRSPISQGKKKILEVLSPRRKKHVDPFAAAVENTRKGPELERGRERGPGLSTNSSRRATRSLSPYRVSAYPWEEEEKQLQRATKQPPFNSQPSNSSSSKGSSRKWRLRDLLLFRSASEGRAADKDPLRKYSGLFRRPEDAKNASFRSTDSSVSASSSRRRGPVSAHELHYTTNKAASEDLKKKTFLPYKRGILGRLAVNPAVHALATGFGSFTRS